MLAVAGIRAPRMHDVWRARRGSRCGLRGGGGRGRCPLSGIWSAARRADRGAHVGHDRLSVVTVGRGGRLHWRLGVVVLTRAVPPVAPSRALAHWARPRGTGRAPRAQLVCRQMMEHSPCHVLANDLGVPVPQARPLQLPKQGLRARRDHGLWKFRACRRECHRHEASVVCFAPRPRWHGPQVLEEAGPGEVEGRFAVSAYGSHDLQDLERVEVRGAACRPGALSARSVPRNLAAVTRRGGKGRRGAVQRVSRGEVVEDARAVSFGRNGVHHVRRTHPELGG